MNYKQNPSTGDWLCWIPGTSQAYYVKSKKQAKKFCNNVNEAFQSGKLIIENGKVVQL